MEPPSSRNYLSFLTYLDRERPLAVSEEAPYLNPREMVSVATGQENTWLEGVIEEILFKFPLRWAQVRILPIEDLGIGQLNLPTEDFYRT
jgi:hypothetical protein